MHSARVNESKIILEEADFVKKRQEKITEKRKRIKEIQSRRETDSRRDCQD